jgi:hypothetical protein
MARARRKIKESRDHQQATDPRYLDRLRAAKYHMTLEQLDALLVSQGGRCAGCGCTEPRGGPWATWAVDHDHSCCARQGSCGKCVRGILCNLCNQALGLVKDSPETLRALVAYLAK